jgi:ankyrin repeat protein
MFYAIKNSNIEFIKFWDKKRIYYNHNYNKFFSLSIMYENIEIAKFFLEKGADVHTDNVIISSIYCGNIEVVKFLIENGADIHNGYDALTKSSFCENMKSLGNFKMRCIRSNDELIEYVPDNSSVKPDKNYIGIMKLLIQSDLDYYTKCEFAKDIVIEHKLVEFYEKFNIE